MTLRGPWLEVKLNAAAIYREDALYKKKQQEAWHTCNPFQALATLSSAF